MKEATTKFLLENWFKLVITLCLITAVSLYFYQTFVLIPQKEEQREFDLRLQKQRNKELFEICESVATQNFNKQSNEACKDRGYKGLPCMLPKDFINRTESNYRWEINECHRKHPH